MRLKLAKFFKIVCDCRDFLDRVTRFCGQQLRIIGEGINKRSAFEQKPFPTSCEKFFVVLQSRHHNYKMFLSFQEINQQIDVENLRLAKNVTFHDEKH